MRRGPVSASGVGGTNLRASYIELGTGPYATTGLIRAGYPATLIVSKDNGGNDRVHLSYGVGGTNQLDVGSGTGVTRIVGANSATDAIYLYSLGTPLCIWGTGIMDTRVPEWRFVSTTAALIRHQNAASGSGSPFRIRARGSTGAGNAGSDLYLEGGRSGAGGAPGGVALFGNRDDSTFDEGFRVGSSGSAAQISYFGGTLATKQTVTGSKGANAALTSLMTALVAYGFVTDSTT